ncbi:MAG: nuclear transport factor 2 family protein [Pelomonas sp.]|nr:nuclear transport factor 2 family protein [Roseateles sp.]
MPSDARTLRDPHVSRTVAVNAGDPARLLASPTGDMVFLNRGRGALGRGGCIDAFGRTRRDRLIDCRSESQEIVVLGDMAYTRCRESLSVTPRAGGAPTRLAGHRLMVCRRQADGRRRLARDARTLSLAADWGRRAGRQRSALRLCRPQRLLGEFRRGRVVGRHRVFVVAALDEVGRAKALQQPAQRLASLAGRAVEGECQRGHGGLAVVEVAVFAAGVPRTGRHRHG